MAKRAAVSNKLIKNKIDYKQCISSTILYICTYDVLIEKFHNSFDGKAGLYYMELAEYIDKRMFKKFLINRKNFSRIISVITG